MTEQWHQPTIGLFTAGEWNHFKAALRQWLVGDQPEAGDVLIDDALLAPSEYTFAQSVHRWMIQLDMPHLAERIDLKHFRERDPFLTVPKGNAHVRSRRTAD